MCWKEKLKEKCGTKVGGYKQVNSKGQVLGSSWWEFQILGYYFLGTEGVGVVAWDSEWIDHLLQYLLLKNKNSVK